MVADLAWEVLMDALEDERRRLLLASVQADRLGEAARRAELLSRCDAVRVALEEGEHGPNALHDAVPVITTAPPEYDYPRIVLHSVQLPLRDRRDRPWRVAVLQRSEAEYQRGRYGSGLHAAPTIREWLDNHARDIMEVTESADQS